MAMAAVSLLVAAALVARANHAEHDEAGSVEMSPQSPSWQALKARAREGHLHLMPHAEKARERKVEMSSAMSHLSSSSLVQRAASECAGEAKCVPTVDELVKRAAAACSKDPSCVCDWGKYPQQCFLSEVQRHKQLEKDAKALVRQINERAASDKVKQAVVTTLEHEEESFEQVLEAGRKAVGAGDFTEGKSALAKAEYLHELAMRKTGDDKGPVMQRQARSLKRFAKEVVEAEAEHRARHRPSERREAGRRERVDRGRDSGMSTVEKQIKALSGNVEKLMHKVGTMEQKNVMKKQMAEAGVVTSSNPKTEVQQLVKEIAGLTGKLGDVEHPGEADHSRVHKRPESAAVARFGAEALAHEESQFAEAIARGERAAFNSKMDQAHMALQEARYYHSEIVRLKGQPRAAPCRPCEALEKSVLRVKRNNNGGGAPAALKGREQELVQVDTDKDNVAAGNKMASTASIESNFDSALSRGEQSRIKGDLVQAQKQEQIAKTALHELNQRELPNGDKLVKQEMGEALESFEHGVRSMPRKQLKAKREGDKLAARVVAEEKSRHVDGGSRTLKRAEKQEKQGSRFVNHLLYGDTKKTHAHHTVSTRGRVAKSHTHMLAHARLDRKHQTRIAFSKSRVDELRQAAERDDRQREQRPAHDNVYDRTMDSARRRDELERVAAHDDRRNDGARRRLHERRGRTREEEPAEREGRGWQGRREAEKQEITEHEGREHLPAYRKEMWQQAPLPKSVLARIYGHFSRH